MGTQTKLGQLIDSTRRAKHIKVQQLIDDVGISRSTYTRILNGKIVPSITIFMRILNQLHLQFDEIWQLLPMFKDSLFGEFAQSTLLMMDSKYFGRPAGLLAYADQLKARFAAQPSAGLEIVNLSIQSEIAEERGQQAVADGMRQHGIEIMNQYEEWNFFEQVYISEWNNQVPIEAYFYMIDQVQREEELENRELSILHSHYTDRILEMFTLGLEKYSAPIMFRVIERMRRMTIYKEDALGQMELLLADAIEVILAGHFSRGEQMINNIYDECLWFDRSTFYFVEVLKEKTSLLFDEQWRFEIRRYLQTKAGNDND